ncbi:MAG: outer membrane protein transport protein [Pseudomonadota bacterium]
MGTKKLLATTALVAVASTTAHAEGIERFNLSTSFMFEEGTYVEAFYGQVTPDLPATDGVGGFAGVSDQDVGEDFDVFGASFKMDVSERFSVGVTFNNQLAGADIEWDPLPIAADVQITGLTLMGKYQVNENISLLGGIKRAELKESTLEVPLVGAETWESSGGDDGYGYVIGAAYEIKDIALRAVLTYESEIQIDPDLESVNGGGGADGQADLSIGDVWNLSFQTGVAQNTLAFANIRYSKWDDNQGFVPTDPFVVGVSQAQVTDFGDGYSYTIGVAQRLSDQWVLSASYFHDPGDGELASPLSPVGATNSITLGARYTLPQGTNISFGYTHSKRGDATVDLGDAGIGTVEGSTVKSVGIRVGHSF